MNGASGLSLGWASVSHPRSGRNLSRSSLSHLVPHHRHSFPATRRLRRNDGGMGDESGASGIGVKW